MTWSERKEQKITDENCAAGLQALVKSINHAVWVTLAVMVPFLSKNGSNPFDFPLEKEQIRGSDP
jgi:hypothetical protein